MPVAPIMAPMRPDTISFAGTDTPLPERRALTILGSRQKLVPRRLRQSGPLEVWGILWAPMAPIRIICRTVTEPVRARAIQMLATDYCGQPSGPNLQSGPDPHHRFAISRRSNSSGRYSASNLRQIVERWTVLCHRSISSPGQIEPLNMVSPRSPVRRSLADPLGSLSPTPGKCC